MLQQFSRQTEQKKKTKKGEEKTIDYYLTICFCLVFVLLWK